MFLALFVHALLVLALTWGVQWRDQPQDMSVEAELWSSIPQPVAAKGEDLEALEEVVKPPPKPEVQPEPKPTPPPPPAKAKPDNTAAKVDIAVEKQKRKEAEDKAKEEAKAKREAKLKEAKEKAEAAKEKKAEEAKKAEERHQEEVKRLRGLADATGTPADTGKVVKAAAPSASYLGKLRAKVKPNIVFSDTQLLSVVGNPAAEVEVTCSPSGQIIGAKLSVSSGNAAWDQAVLNAVEKTGSLPRDESGNVPNKIAFLFRPRD
jgi:colicin import membrane protein